LLVSLTALLVFPVILAMTLGTAALLEAVGDSMAAAACRWIALGLGVMWGGSVVATAALSALISLEHRDRPRWRSRRRLRTGHGESVADRSG
jgi:hypothetical protein